MVYINVTILDVNSIYFTAGNVLVVNFDHDVVDYDIVSVAGIGGSVIANAR